MPLPVRQAMEFDAFRLDLRDERLWRGAQPVELRAKTWQVLRYLATNPGRLVTADELLSAVWPNAHVTPANLNQSIYELRRALGDDTSEPRIIETVRGRGFCFVAKIRSSHPESARTPRFSGMSGTSPDAVYGREPDLERLAVLFRRAQAGERQIAFVTGEAGIGKTSLVRTFLDRLAETDEPVWIGWGQCVEQHGAGEAYLPLLEALDRLAREGGTDRVRRALWRWAPTWLSQLPSLLQPDEAPAAPVGTPPARMLREFYLAVEALAEERTLVLCLEDLHWSDPATVDLLSALMRRPESAQLLVVVTYRPVDAAMSAHPVAALKRSFLLEKRGGDLALELLGERAVSDYLRSRFGMELDAFASLVFQITDGNPLFMVTLLSYFVNERWLTKGEAGWTLAAPLEWLRERAPESLKAVLEARLAQCSREEIEVLEAASVAGETSAAQAVAAALGAEVETVEKVCGRLAGWKWFLEGIGGARWPDGSMGERYRFLHATFRRILYDRLPSGRRQLLHLRIARRLETGYEGVADPLAAELALHCEQGGDLKGAIEHLARAAANVRRRLAEREAVAYLTHALELIATLPPSCARSEHELGLRMQLARSVLVAVGSSSIERAANVARARELAIEVGDFRTQSLILSWQMLSKMGQGELRAAKQLAEENANLTAQIDDPLLRSYFHGALGNNYLLRGEFEAAEREHGLVPIELEGIPPGKPSNVLGLDPAALAFASSAWTAWLRGYPNEALRRSQASLARAKKVGDPFAMATALVTTQPVAQFCRDANLVQSLGRSLAEILGEFGFDLTYTWRYAPEGWLHIRRREDDAAIDSLRFALAATKTSGALCGLTLLLATLAEAELARKSQQAGLDVITEALAFVESHGERFWEPELHRIRGELLRLDAHNDLAEASFHTALEQARHIGARSLALRAATSLTRLWKDSDRADSARVQLSELYGEFTEGFDTPDLKDAKTLLDSFSQPTERMSAARRKGTPRRRGQPQPIDGSEW